MTTGSGSSTSMVPDTKSIFVNQATIWPPQAYNPKSRFAVWESQFKMYLGAAKITDPQMQVFALLQHIGTDMYEKIMDWTSKEPSELPYDELIELIRDKCSSKPNLFALRVKFFNEKQQPGQTLEDYFNHMSQLYKQCRLNEMTAEDFGVLAVLKGLINDDTRQFLMTSGGAAEMKSMQKVQDLASIFEQGKAAAKEIKGDGGYANVNPYSMNLIGKGPKCKFCGEGHQPGKERCPANGKKCSSCGKQNHFARVCKSSRKQNQVEEYSDGETPRDRERSTDGYSSLNGIYGVLTVSSRHEEDHPPIKVEAKLDGTTVYFQHDSGAAVSVISKKVWHQIGEPEMHPTGIELQSYTGRIPVIGQSKVFVQVGSQLKQQWIVVVPHGESLFGRNFIQEFGVDSQRFCNQSKDRRDDATVHKMNTVMVAQPIDRRCRKPKVCFLNTVNVVCSYDYRNANAGKKSCSWKKEAKLMHDPMQGKVKEGSGKGLNELNGRALADKIRRKCFEGGVLKDFKSHSCKQNRSWIAKDLQDAVNQDNWRAVKGQEDHTSQSPMMKADKASPKKGQKREQEYPKSTKLRRGTVTCTDCVTASQARDRDQTKIQKKAYSESREGAENI